MYESALTPKTLTTTGNIVTHTTSTIIDSAEVTVGRTKRPIFWILCTGTAGLVTGSVTLKYMGSVAGLDYAEVLSTDVTFIAGTVAGTYVGSKAFDCDYDIIKLTQVINWTPGLLNGAVIRVSGVARDV